MKTKLLLLALLSPFAFLLSPCTAQVPQGFNYQAVAHNSAGAPIMNTIIQVKMGILSDTITPVVVWEELHSAVKTNVNGVFNLVIGTGTRQAGSAQNFSDIDWTISPLFLKIQINYQGAWKYMGSAKLWSVPYSMVAGELEGSVRNLEVIGEDETSDEALFEVKRKDGQTMFAVYNHGVRVYMPLDTLSKTRKGGFAIGGFSGTKGVIQDYFVVNPDSIRAYINTNPSKAVKGGFAIGGFGTVKTGTQNYLFVSSDSIRAYIDTASVKGVKGGFAIGGFEKTKSPAEEYLRVTRDSTRIYIKDAGTKAVKGGFAIGGFGNTKGDINNFLDLTPRNYFVGHSSGQLITTGLFNSAIGFESGFNLNSGESNAFMGYQSGFNNSLGSGNLFLGYKSGYSNQTGNFNTYLGYVSGYSNTSGWFNTFLGSFAGYSNTVGSSNTFIGDSTGYYNVNGYRNTFLGTHTGKKNGSGYENVFIGDNSGYKNTEGSNNVFIGTRCGHNNTTGRDNVFIGTSSGFSNTLGFENVSIGWGTGYFNTTSALNVFIGSMTGHNNNTGEKNTLIGSYAGHKNTIGNNNTLVGCDAGHYIETGSNNVFLGFCAGNNSVHGSRNVFIGDAAGYYELGSDKLYIDNGGARDSANVLIYGDFEKKYLRFNALGIAAGWKTEASGSRSSAFGYKTISCNDDALAIGNTTMASGGQSLAMGYLSYASGWVSAAFGFGSKAISHGSFVLGSFNDTTNMTNTGATDPTFVIGNGTSNSDRKNAFTVLQNSMVGINMVNPQQMLDIAGGNGRIESGFNWLTDSDIRYKKNIEEIENSLEIVLAMHGVRFDLINDNSSAGFPAKNIGFIAQELETVIPEVVVTGSDGYKSVAYDKLTAVLTEAIKEQQQQIDLYKSENDNLKSQLQSLQKEVEQIKALLQQEETDN